MILVTFRGEIIKTPPQTVSVQYARIRFRSKTGAYTPAKVADLEPGTKVLMSGSIGVSSMLASEVIILPMGKK